MTNHVTNITSYRVIYGDTDQMGVVYYANYLRWFERGRAEFLRQIGLPYANIEAAGFHFPVAEVKCRYAQSARYDEIIEIATTLVDLSRVYLVFDYQISRQADQLTLATGSTKHACIDREGQLKRIPQMLADAIELAKRNPPG
ncbi:MAG: acyl-CoA thioesterase [Candidatus Binatota bacterium]|nr:acyl-CoA thioesterase [Candidatus Binatota bacterium]